MNKTLAIVLCLVGTAWAAATFDIALPGYRYGFPRDHGSHDGYKTEWWYYTGHLFSDDGREWGYELTFFRFATVPLAEQRQAKSRWYPGQLYLAHLALSDVQGHHFQYWEKLNRAGIGTAGARTGSLDVWNDGWSARGLPDGGMALHATVDGFDLDLHLESPIPPVVHGTDGISKKGDGISNASHYYSLTRLLTKGTLTASGHPITVHGLTWMDHEFGSSQLSNQQVGWNWYALQLDNQTELMLYQMRNRNGTPDQYSSGTLVEGTKVTHLTSRDFAVTASGTWTSPHSHGTYPMGWTIDVPGHALRADVQPLLRDQELVTRNSTGVTYWEGTCAVKATVSGRPASGRAYVEMTGYADRLNF